MKSLPVSCRLRSLRVAAIDSLVQTYGGREDMVLACAGESCFGPPPAPLYAHAGSVVRDAAVDHGYGSVQGDPALLGAVRHKLREQNGVDVDAIDYRVTVTAGSNQAFVNVLLCVCDAGDEVILFAPYYFSHHSACLQSNVTPRILHRAPGQSAYAALSEWVQGEEGKPAEDGHDSIDRLQRVRAVVVCTPDNPTGDVLENGELEGMADICWRHGWWLVMDEAYEHFDFRQAATPVVEEAPAGMPIARRRPYAMHRCTIHLFTMSKSFGMAGYRVGYVIYPHHRDLHQSMLKVNDTLVTHAGRASQRLAAGVLRDPACIAVLQSRQLAMRLRHARVMHRLTQMEEHGWVRLWGRRHRNCSGAFYAFMQVCPGVRDAAAERPAPGTDMQLCCFLAERFSVLVAPGQVFGTRPEDCCIRFAFGALDINRPDVLHDALNRLERGIIAFASHGHTTRDRG